MRHRSPLLAVFTVVVAGLGLRVLHGWVSPEAPHAGILPLALMTFAVAAFIDAER